MAGWAWRGAIVFCWDARLLVVKGKCTLVRQDED